LEYIVMGGNGFPLWCWNDFTNDGMFLMVS